MTALARRTRVALLLFACGALAPQARAAPPSALHLRIEGVINPITARYVDQSLRRARERHASFVLVSIDTPGGLVTSMQDIVKSFANCGLPVIGLVEPASAQATSAGAFVLLATDLAAMLPDTRVGAAHPVGSGAALDKTMDRKATNSLASMARSLARRHGRSQQVAEAMVRKSNSYTAQEAVAAHVVEWVVRDRTELLARLDGFTLEAGGRSHVLHTQGLQLIESELSPTDRLLDRLADPSIASILLTIGVLGILYELSAPGIGLGGIVGVIALLLGLLSMSALPIQTAGVLLLVAGAIAIAIEVFTPAHGLLGAGGVLALIAGALVLIDEARYFGAVQRVDWRLFAPAAAMLTAGLLAIAATSRRALRAPPQTGVEALRGARGVAKSSFVPEGDEFVGSIFVAGALWQASAREPIERGEPIEVLAVHTQPMRLYAARAPRREPETS